jgi:hypothetical protein
MRFQLEWLEGSIASQEGRPDVCEKLLLAARSGFSTACEIGYAAAVDLDLAELFLKERQVTRAVSHALAAIPIFEHFSADREAAAALTLLGEVATKQTITDEVVSKIRSYLQHLLQSRIGFIG